MDIQDFGGSRSLGSDSDSSPLAILPCPFADASASQDCEESWIVEGSRIAGDLGSWMILPCPSADAPGSLFTIQDYEESRIAAGSRIVEESRISEDLGSWMILPCPSADAPGSLGAGRPSFPQIKKLPQSESSHGICAPDDWD